MARRDRRRRLGTPRARPLRRTQNQGRRLPFGVDLAGLDIGTPTADPRPGVSDAVAWLRRYRWQAAPLYAGGALYGAAGLAQVTPGWTAAALAAAGGWAWWAARRLEPAETTYARAVIGGAAAWEAWAWLVDPVSWWAALPWAAGVVIGGRRWWTNHRVRSRIRLEATLRAWPGDSARAQLAGVRIVSALGRRFEDVLRLELPRGRLTRADVAGRLRHLASVWGIPEGWLRLVPHPTDPGVVDLHVTRVDPWRDAGGRVVPLAHPAAADPATWAAGTHSITDPIPIGVTPDGEPYTVRLYDSRGARIVLVAGNKGSGKSVTVHDVMAGLARCGDVDIVAIDVPKRGETMRAWERRLAAPVATTRAQAEELLRWLLDEIGRRADAKGPGKWIPGPERRALVLVVEELGALVGAYAELGPLISSMGRLIRSVGMPMVLVEQAPDASTLGSVLGEQIDVRVVGRMTTTHRARMALGDVDEVNPAEFAGDVDGQLAVRGETPGRTDLARAWLLEDPAAIGAIVEVSPPPGEHITSRSTLGDSVTDTDRPPATSAGLATALDQVVAEYATVDLSEVPNVGLDVIREHGARSPEPPPTPEEHALDARIMEALEEAGPDGVATRELEATLGEPRSTIQARCKDLKSRGKATSIGSGPATRWVSAAALVGSAR